MRAMAPARSASFGPKKAGGAAQASTAPANAGRRPRSAQTRAPRGAISLAKALGDATSSKAATEQQRVLKALHVACQELKSSANVVNEENLRMRTRILALERELQRRERLLQQMLKISQAGQGFGMDIIEKLREERNMLPIYRRKSQELHAQSEAREAEIRAIKRDPHFTRIIELQVQFASWQHEAQRLESLLSEPSTDDNDRAREEVESYERQVERLQGELTTVEARQDELSRQLRDAKRQHGECRERHAESEARLAQKQEETRQLVATYKSLLLKRSEAERLDSEAQQMALSKRQHEAEMKKLRGAQFASASSPSRGGRRVSHAALAGQLPPLPSASDLPRLWALRRAAARCSGSSSLFAQCLSRECSPGLIDLEGLTAALAAVQCPQPSETAAVLLRWLQKEDEHQPAPLRWPDMLAALDRLSSASAGAKASGSMTAPSQLPSLRSLRAACLREGTSREELAKALQEANSFAAARKVFAKLLGENSAATEAWLESWLSCGQQGLLLRLPLSEAAMSQAAYQAWLARCSDAVRLHRRELTDSFKVWREDMMLEENQFRIVMIDVVGAELSEEDIDDLMLWAGGGGSPGGVAECVDGREVLTLAER